jgi:hypothetical protein
MAAEVLAGNDLIKAPIDLLKEGGAEPGVLKVVVLGRVVQLMFGKAVKFGPLHTAISTSYPLGRLRRPNFGWGRVLVEGCSEIDSPA